MPRDMTALEAVDKLKRMLKVKPKSDCLVVARYESWGQYILECQELGVDQGSDHSFRYCLNLIRKSRKEVNK